MRTWAVAVIGAGPAGLHAARQLAQSGLDVVVLESQQRIGDRAICSGVIGEEAFHRFDLPKSSVLASISRIEAVSPTGRSLVYGAGTPMARVVDKGEFNRALADRAKAAGAEILLGCSVVGIFRLPEGVILQLRSAQGELLQIRARASVIASGVASPFNRMLGLATPRQFLRAAQADVHISDGEKGLTQATRVYVGRTVAPGAFGWTIPVGCGRFRLGVMSRQDPRPYFTRLLRRVAGEVDESTLKIREKAIAQAPVGNCTSDRLMAVGESAGHVKTSTGGGIYYGLLSAELASEVLVRAFHKGNLSASGLADFERLARDLFRNELSIGYLSRKIACRLPDTVIERAFEVANSVNLLGRLDGKLKFDWHHKALSETLRMLPVWLNEDTLVAAQGRPRVAWRPECL